MAWKKFAEKSHSLEDKHYDEIWVYFGKEPKGDNAKGIKEGESIEGYLEKLVKSPKFKQPIVALVSEKDNIRYLMLAPKDLENKIDSLIEKMDGKMVYTKITFVKAKELGDDKDATHNKDATNHRKIYIFEVDYDDENILEA